jgi:hypothetical protein
MDHEEEEIKDSKHHEDFNLPLSKLFQKRLHEKKNRGTKVVRRNVRQGNTFG